MNNDKHAITVLVVDDDEEDFLIFKDLISQIKEQKFIVEWASSYQEGRAALLQQAHEIYFLDYRLGAETGLQLIEEVAASGGTRPMILLTGYGDHEVDLEAMRIGAADYVVKDQMTPGLLERSIRYSLHRAETLAALKEQEAKIIMQDRLASIGLLASSLAHEIGTPLGVIRGRAEYLLMQVSEDEKIKKNVDVIISQIDRVSKLIRSLLNLARGDQMKLASEVNLNEVVTEVGELLAHEFKTHQIELKNEVNFDSTVKVKVQAEPLHQVLLNLLINSIHAIETAVKSGRPDSHFIRLWTEERAGLWYLNVYDSGCGISEENQRQLFKPFFTTKEIGQGTGLGLATSYRLIEAWGGSIQVESKEGEFTLFKLLLPKVAQH